MVLRKSQQTNLSGIEGSSLPFRVKRVIVAVAIILCAVVKPCESQNNQLSCGKRQEDLVSTRITWGEGAQLGDWPWHTAIFSSAYGKSQYICGGSIIHKNSVISSAHCFVSFNRLVHEDLITVHVGRVDLNTFSDDFQVYNVSELIVHPKFFTLIGTLKYDIAILKLSTDIVMSWSVHPVCIWDMAEDHSELVGETGTIVGFGFNEHNEPSSILQKAELTVVDVYDCLDNDRETYGRVLTRNMYCASGKANVSACNGDSGGGMFFEQNGTWFICGIISFIAMRPDAALCDTSKYTVFTDVGGFYGWIMESISDFSVTKRQWYQTPCRDKPTPKDGTCNIAHLFDHNFLFVGWPNRITRVLLNGKQQILVPTTPWVNGLDHDCAAGRFYWSTAMQIRSAKYDGTDQKVFIEEDIKEPENLAVDWISRRLYWIDWDKSTIEVASLENPNVRTVLIYELFNPRFIAVDPLRSKLYWTSRSEEKTIEWSNLDGTERQVLNENSDMLGIKVFTATGELCSVNKRTKQIECIDPFSKQIRTITSNLTDQLAITDELIYWIDLSSKAIESIDFSGVRRKPFKVPESDSMYPNVVSAVTDKCLLRYSPCAINNGDCPENTICLVNPSAEAGRSCK